MRNNSEPKHTHTHIFAIANPGKKKMEREQMKKIIHERRIRRHAHIQTEQD